jgi:hypothetical protein
VRPAIASMNDVLISTPLISIHCSVRSVAVERDAAFRTQRSRSLKPALLSAEMAADLVAEKPSTSEGGVKTVRRVWQRRTLGKQGKSEREANNDDAVTLFPGSANRVLVVELLQERAIDPLLSSACTDGIA